MDKKVSETKPDFSTQARIVWRNVIVSYAWGSLFINHLQVSHEMRREKSRRLEMNRKPWKRAQQIGQLLKKDFTSNFLRSDLREINLVRLTQCGNFAIFVPLWFHVKYEWQKNFKFSHYYCDHTWAGSPTAGGGWPPGGWGVKIFRPPSAAEKFAPWCRHPGRGVV